CDCFIRTLLWLPSNGMHLDSWPKAACNGNQFVDVVLGARTRRGEARQNPLWPDFLAAHLKTASTSVLIGWPEFNKRDAQQPYCGTDQRSSAPAIAAHSSWRELRHEGRPGR